MIRFSHSGSFNNIEKFLNNSNKKNYRTLIDRHASDGVKALEAATPKDSGITANSWHYEIKTKPSGFSIYWTNDHVNEGVPIVILIQYGHGTRSGGFIEGKDFINPAMRPIFDKIVEDLWKEVNSL